MGDGDAKDFVGGNFAGVRRIFGDGLEKNVFAAELEGSVADESAGEQTGLAKDLEAIADTEDGFALGGETLDGLHDGTETGDGAGAEVIAIAESAGNDDGVKTGKGVFLVPDKTTLMAENVNDGVEGVLIAIGGGELEDG